VRSDDFPGWFGSEKKWRRVDGRSLWSLTLSKVEKTESKIRNKHMDLFVFSVFFFFMNQKSLFNVLADAVWCRCRFRVDANLFNNKENNTGFTGVTAS
jgi:hypothetical protein